MIIDMPGTGLAFERPADLLPHRDMHCYSSEIA